MMAQNQLYGNMKILGRNIAILIRNQIVPHKPKLFPFAARKHHCAPPQEQLQSSNNSTLINAICNSLRQGHSWDALTAKFNTVHFSEPIIENVLLQLKQPIDAKPALSFFHWLAHHNHFRHDTSTYCLTIHRLVKGKLIKDARALLESILTKPPSFVFDKSPALSVFNGLVDSYKAADSTPLVFDLLVQTCAKLRMIDGGAIDVCECLYEHGFGLSLISYNTLLHVIQKSDQTHLVWRVYEDMLERRAYPNEKTVEIMVSAVCKEGTLQEVVNVVERMHGKTCSNPRVLVNTCLVLGMMEERRIDEAVALLKTMLQKNVILHSIVYCLIVKARLELTGLDSAKQVYEEMLNRGFQPNSYVYTLFIKASSQAGRVNDAYCLMEEMKTAGLKPYDETYNHLIMGFSHTGNLRGSLKICQEMIDMKLLPSLSVFNHVVQSLCRKGDAKQCDDMLTKLLGKGFVPDALLYSNLIASYVEEGDSEGAIKLYYEMKYRSLSPTTKVLSSLKDYLSRCGRLEGAINFVRQ